MAGRGRFNKFASRADNGSEERLGSSSGSGSYRPPHARRTFNNNHNQSKGKFQPSIASTLSIDPAAAERRKQRFSNDQKKEDENYGLLSRGEDTRLQRDPQARRDFFKKIQQSFTEELSESDVETIRGSFSKLNLEDQTQMKTIDTTLMSLRKLREALLNFPPDDFSKSVFLYSIRVATKAGHYQTYIPSISFLLKHVSILKPSELNEVVSVFVLHLAHFSNDNGLALQALYRYASDDLKLQQILKAWRTMDYHTWLKLYHLEKDLMFRKMMSFGRDKMMAYAIKCLQKSYFQLPKAYINEVLHVDFEVLQEDYQCDWTSKGSMVVIRSRS